MQKIRRPQERAIDMVKRFRQEFSLDLVTAKGLVCDGKAIDLSLELLCKVQEICKEFDTEIVEVNEKEVIRGLLNDIAFSTGVVLSETRTITEKLSALQKLLK